MSSVLKKADKLNLSLSRSFLVWVHIDSLGLVIAYSFDSFNYFSIIPENTNFQAKNWPDTELKSSQNLPLMSFQTLKAVLLTAINTLSDDKALAWIIFHFIRDFWKPPFYP